MESWVFGVETRLLTLKKGLTGLAAWSAQASDKARSIPLYAGFCDRSYYKKTLITLIALIRQ
jgi:hypothetical protein